MRLDAGDRVVVVGAHDELVRLRPVEDLLEHVAAAGAHVELELRSAGEPARPDQLAAVAPEAHLGLPVREGGRQPCDLAVRALAVGPQFLRQFEDRLEVGKELLRRHVVSESGRARMLRE